MVGWVAKGDSLLRGQIISDLFFIPAPPRGSSERVRDERMMCVPINGRSLLSGWYLATDFLMASLTVRWSNEKLHNLIYFPNFMLIPELLDFTQFRFKSWVSRCHYCLYLVSSWIFCLANTD